MKSILYVAVATVCLPMAGMAASVTTGITATITNTSNGGVNLTAASAGGASQSTASGPFKQTAAFGTASTLQGTILPGGQFSGSGSTVTASSVNGKTLTQAFGWSAP